MHRQRGATNSAAVLASTAAPPAQGARMPMRTAAVDAFAAHKNEVTEGYMAAA